MLIFQEIKTSFRLAGKDTKLIMKNTHDEFKLY